MDKVVLALVDEMKELAAKVISLEMALEALLSNGEGLKKDRDLYLARLDEARKQAKETAETVGEAHQMAHEDRAKMLEQLFNMAAEVAELKTKVASLEKKTKNL